VLLTGANGFVGSHILDCLIARRIPVRLLLRSGSSRQFIETRLSDVEVSIGSILEPESLRPAVHGVSHVIHCAGATKAVRASDLFQVNQIGTRNVIEALNAEKSAVPRLVHLSSLAAAGPATPHRPRREEDPPQPISAYGQSKLAAEQEILNHWRAQHVILRPPAVYGPRDRDFLRLFKAVKSHLLPAGRQVLSLAFVRDLSEVVVSCLDHPAVAGRTFFVAGPEAVSTRRMAQEIATQMGVRTLPLPLPKALLWLVCLAQEVGSRLTGKPSILSLQKWPELRACHWMCDPSRLEREVGLRCSTTLATGVQETLNWYRQNQWL